MMYKKLYENRYFFNKSLKCFKLNQQYIVEGFSAGFMMLLGGIGIIILEKSVKIQSR